jgi:XTP/dITP diphosphohydrolase
LAETLVLASRNAHKARELGALLSPWRLEALPRDVDLPPESGETFADNAVIKARAAAAALGRPAVADDSGIEASALGGAPGVRSARYAGVGASDADNLAKLLAEVPPDGDRRARYICVLAYYDLGEGRPRLFEGTCDGVLATEPRGSGGFGYDPAFIPVEVADGRTMAELAPAEKDAISHRGRAARVLRAWLEAREEVGR